MVGGFSESPFLKSIIKSQFETATSNMEEETKLDPVHVLVPSSTIVCATHQVSCTLVIMVTVSLALTTGSRGGAARPKVVSWIAIVSS